MPHRRKKPGKKPPEAARPAADAQDAVTDPPDAAGTPTLGPPPPFGREEQIRLRRKLQDRYH
ncbi:hypothetical protein [Streptomyces sp. YKOK-I1]